MLLFWPLLGAAIGAYAAQRRGFSVLGGVIAGLLLGPFAFLLFLVAGIFSSSEQQRKCPYCAEWVQQEAVICKHCHKDLAPFAKPPAIQKTSPIVKIAVGILAAFGVFIAWLVVTEPSNSISLGSFGADRILEPVVSLSKYNRLQEGMTYFEAVQVIGSAGEELSRSEIAGIKTIMFAWKNPNGSNMNAMFQNDKLVTKAQFGLH